MCDQFQRTWEKAVTGKVEKLCNGDFVISDIFKVTKLRSMWAGHAACWGQITKVCSILGRNS